MIGAGKTADAVVVGGRWHKTSKMKHRLKPVTVGEAWYKSTGLTD
jgi:hypothetical protein